MYNSTTCAKHLKRSIKFFSTNELTYDAEAALDHCIFSLAALRGNEASVDRLMSPLSDILKPDVINCSALYHAFANGHYAVAKDILAAAVARGESCYTEFCRALDEPRYLYFLFDQCAEVSDSRWFTPLEYAEKDKNTALIHKLMELKEKRLHFGNLALHHAIELNDVTYTHYLLSQPGLTAHDLSTPLCLAASYGHLQLVTMLCQHPAINVKAKDKAGLTPLEYAIDKGHLAIIQYLLNQPEIIKTLPNKRAKLLQRLRSHFAPELLPFQAIKFMLEVTNEQTKDMAFILHNIAVWLSCSCYLAKGVRQGSSSQISTAWHNANTAIINWLNIYMTTPYYQQLVDILENARSQAGCGSYWRQGLAILCQLIQGKIEPPQLQPEQESTVQLASQP